MQFRFKIQQYQTDAVDSVARVFQGQPKVEGLSYRRDVGEAQPLLPGMSEQTSMFPSEQASIFDPVDDTGYLNEALHLTDSDLLQNIRGIQNELNVFRLIEAGTCELYVFSYAVA